MALGSLLGKAATKGAKKGAKKTSGKSLKETVGQVDDEGFEFQKVTEAPEPTKTPPVDKDDHNMRVRALGHNPEQKRRLERDWDYLTPEQKKEVSTGKVSKGKVGTWIEEAKGDTKKFDYEKQKIGQTVNPGKLSGKIEDPKGLDTDPFKLKKKLGGGAAMGAGGFGAAGFEPLDTELIPGTTPVDKKDEGREVAAGKKPYVPAPTKTPAPTPMPETPAAKMDETGREVASSKKPLQQMILNAPEKKKKAIKLATSTPIPPMPKSKTVPDMDTSKEDAGKKPDSKTPQENPYEKLMRQREALIASYSDTQNRMEWLQAAEKLAHAITQYAAARKGAATGYDLSNIKMTPTDWAKKMEQKEKLLDKELAHSDKQIKKLDDDKKAEDRKKEIQADRDLRTTLTNARISSQEKINAINNARMMKLEKIRDARAAADRASRSGDNQARLAAQKELKEMDISYKKLSDKLSQEGKRARIEADRLEKEAERAFKAGENKKARELKREATSLRESSRKEKLGWQEKEAIKAKEKQDAAFEQARKVVASDLTGKQTKKELLKIKGLPSETYQKILDAQDGWFVDEAEKGLEVLNAEEERLSGTSRPVIAPSPSSKPRGGRILKSNELPDID